MPFSVQALFEAANSTNATADDSPMLMSVTQPRCRQWDDDLKAWTNDSCEVSKGHTNVKALIWLLPKLFKSKPIHEEQK